MELELQPQLQTTMHKTNKTPPSTRSQIRPPSDCARSQAQARFNLKQTSERSAQVTRFSSQSSASNNIYLVSSCCCCCCDVFMLKLKISAWLRRKTLALVCPLTKRMEREIYASLSLCCWRIKIEIWIQSMCCDSARFGRRPIGCRRSQIERSRINTNDNTVGNLF